MGPADSAQRFKYPLSNLEAQTEADGAFIRDWLELQKRDLAEFARERRTLQMRRAVAGGDQGATEAQVQQLFASRVFTAHEAKEAGTYG